MPSGRLSVLFSAVTCRPLLVKRAKTNVYGRKGRSSACCQLWNTASCFRCCENEGLNIKWTESVSVSTWAVGWWPSQRGKLVSMSLRWMRWGAPFSGCLYSPLSPAVPTGWGKWFEVWCLIKYFHCIRQAFHSSFIKVLKPLKGYGIKLVRVCARI